MQKDVLIHRNHPCEAWDALVLGVSVSGEPEGQSHSHLTGMEENEVPGLLS